MPRQRKTISHSQRIETMENPQGRVDHLGYHVAQRLINNYENGLGAPKGTIFTHVKEPIAKVANVLQEEVLKLGIDPDVIGMALGLGALFIAKQVTPPVPPVQPQPQAAPPSPPSPPPQPPPQQTQAQGDGSWKIRW